MGAVAIAYYAGRARGLVRRHLLAIVFLLAAVILVRVAHELAPALTMGTFIGAAKKRNQILGSVQNDAGSRVPRRIELRNAGYLDRLFLLHAYDFQFGVANPTSADAFGQAGGQIERFTLQSNSVGLLYDVSGEMAKVIAALDDAQRRGGGSQSLDPAPNKFTAAPAVAATTNVWATQIPIALYFNNKPWPVGLYQMALNALEVDAMVRFRPLRATAGTPGSGLYVPAGGTTTVQDVRGDLKVQQQYFDPIANPQDQPTLAFVHQWREFQVPVSANGDLDIRLPPSNLYMRLIYWLVTGGAGALAPDATSLTKLQLRYGANFAPFEEDASSQFSSGFTSINRGGQVTHRQNRMFDNMFGVGGAAYDGVYVHDFFSENDNEQDFINSAATTDLRATLSIAGATLSGGAYVKVATEQLIPLVVPAAGAGNVQGVS